MRVVNIDTGDTKCCIIFSAEKSPLTISLTPADADQPRFGAMAYAVPPEIGTTLVPSETYEEVAQRLAKLLAKRFQRPVFLNSSVEASFNLYTQVAAAVEAALADAL